MPELLVRVVDKAAPDDLAPYVFHEGDVLVACENGWPWSARELTNPEWRILRTSLLQSEIDTLTLCARQPSETAPDDSPVRPREYFLDIDKLTAPSRFRGPRTDENAIIVMPRAEVVPAITQKEPAP